MVEETNAADHNLAVEAHALFSLISKFKISTFVEVRQEVTSQSQSTQPTSAANIVRGRTALAHKQDCWEDF